MDFDTNESINPDTEALQQEDLPGEPVVPVRQIGPMLTHELPARVAYSRSVNVTESGDPAMLEIIASEDLRRKFLFVSVTGQPCHVGFDKQEVASGVAGILPIGMLLPLPTSAPVWVRAAAVGTAVVSYWVGNWAD